MTSRRPWRDPAETRLGSFHASQPPGGVLVPAPVAWVLERQARHHRTLHALRATVQVSVALALLTLLLVRVQPVMAISAPGVPASEQICGSAVLNGPSTAPGGAVTVPAGDNSAFFANQLAPNTTYWFAAGTHTILSGAFGIFSNVIPANGDVFTGAPGAILDGSNFNQSAFGQNATNVTVEYLTIQNYKVPGAQGALTTGPGWTLQYLTVQDNLPGAGVYLGSNTTLQDSCITQNGQVGFGTFTTVDTSPLTGGAQNITIDGNEISYNDTCNWENAANFPATPPAGCAGAGQHSGCGCSGAGKYFQVAGGQFENNYVHDDYSVGPWWDTNDTGMTITGNYIAREWSYGLIYEISYNAQIADNVFVDDAWGDAVGKGFPNSAIYISESGSDPRVPGPYGSQFLITGNTFVDNWGGVILWESSDRFCTSSANTSSGACTLVAPGSANMTTCQTSLTAPSRPVGPALPPGRRTRGGRGYGQGQGFQNLIDVQPYISDCRWKTQNVTVTGNTFSFTVSDIPDCTPAQWCGFNGLFSVFGVYPPYLGFYVPQNLTYSQNDLFSGNTYCGPWEFDTYTQGNPVTWATWLAGPSSQDPGSTLNSPACWPTPVQPAWRNPVNRTVTIPIRIGR